MIPYIVILSFLIIIILYEVYTTSEAFSAAQDASGNDVKVSLTDLYALLGPFKTKSKDASGNTVPIRDASGTSIRVASPAEMERSSLAAQEITDRLAKAVSKQVKDDLAAQRSTDDLYDKYAPCDVTDAEAQGQEYAKVKPRPSSQPDMSEYIRKDSIPCWNCSVP